MNVVFPKYKEAVIQGAANSSLAGTLKAVLIDLADYTYSAAHEFYSSASVGAVGTPTTVGSKTFVGGLLDGADVSFTGVTGDPCEALILFLDTGTPTTSRLVAYFDTGVTGLPVTPNGGNISITWNAAGIIQF